MTRKTLFFFFFFYQDRAASGEICFRFGPTPGDWYCSLVLSCVACRGTLRGRMGLENKSRVSPDFSLVCSILQSPVEQN